VLVSVVVTLTVPSISGSIVQSMDEG
jgi:hypothetical protein